MNIFLTLFLLWFIGAVLSQVARFIILNSEKILGRSFLPPTVAVIRLTGVIADSSPSAFNIDGFINWRSFRQSFARAVALPNLKAIILEINSPGGSPVQCSLFVKRLAQLKEELNKENRKIDLLCFIEDICASGGYFIASACDHIICDESSLVGSIGVINSGFGFEGLIDKLGVKRRVYTAGSSKAFMDPFKPEKPEDIAILETILSNLHDNFKDVVTHSRNSKLDQSHLDEIFSGALWDGKTALKLGLVDEIGERVLWCKNNFGANVNFIEIRRRPNFFEAFAEMRANAFEAGSSFNVLRNLSVLRSFGVGSEVEMSENLLRSVEAKLKTNPVMAISNVGFTQFNF